MNHLDDRTFCYIRGCWFEEDNWFCRNLGPHLLRMFTETKQEQDDYADIIISNLSKKRSWVLNVEKDSSYDIMK